MRYLLAILLATLLAVVPMSADRHRSSRKSPAKPKAAKVDKPGPVTYSYDTIIPAPTDITIAGYDKPLSSTSESFFLSNHTDRPLCGISFTVEYRDMLGRMLHKQQRTRQIYIPVGETRQLNFPSWDHQGNFYYHKSRTPRVPATPYDITLTVNYILLTPNH